MHLFLTSSSPTFVDGAAYYVSDYLHVFHSARHSSMAFIASPRRSVIALAAYRVSDSPRSLMALIARRVSNSSCVSDFSCPSMALLVACLIPHNVRRWL